MWGLLLQSRPRPRWVVVSVPASLSGSSTLNDVVNYINLYIRPSLINIDIAFDGTTGGPV